VTDPGNSPSESQMSTGLYCDCTHVAQISMFGQCLTLLTDSSVAMAWAHHYLGPFSDLQHASDGRSLGALVAAFSTFPRPSRPRQPSETRGLPGGRVADCWDTGNETLFVDRSSQDIFAVSTERAEILYLPFEASHPSLREPACLVADELCERAISHGALPLQGCAVNIDGVTVAFLGADETNRAALLCRAIDGLGGRYVAQDKFVITPEASRLHIWGIPTPCHLDAGTLRSSSRLKLAAGAWDHLAELVDRYSSVNDNSRIITITPSDLTDALGASIVRTTPLDAVVLLASQPNVGPAPASLAPSPLASSALRSYALDPYPNAAAWGCGRRTSVWNTATERTLGALTQLPIFVANPVPAGSVGLSTTLRSVLDEVCPPVPDHPDPQRWLRGPLRGKLVTVMDHRRARRGMQLAPWTTRALRRGEVHELVGTDTSGPLSSGDRVDRVGYLGFAEFEAGILAVGDTLRTNGRELGWVIGFDDTHAPNHLNILVRMTVLRTGTQLGLRPGDELRFEPVRSAELRGS
jgi:hypothetical protein